MWRLDRRNGNDVPEPGPELFDQDAVSASPTPETAEPAPTAAGPSFAHSATSEATIADWLEELARIGGESALVHFRQDAAAIDLSSTHPGGMPQFITGNSTLLSNLIRDELALRTAKLAAEDIAQKGIELRSARGIEAVNLAIGIAEWSHAGEDYRAPVLLRPLAIRRYGRDFELKLKGEPVLNPALARALREQFQVNLDARAFVALAISNGIFKPQPVIDRLRGLTGHVDGFNVSPKLLVSTFAEVGPELAEDAGRGADSVTRTLRLQHPVIGAVAGNPSARASINRDATTVELVSSDIRPPATDRLLLDADAEQEEVISTIAAGTSLVVRTLPGTGGTQTIVNAIGALIAGHKRVLVVSPRRSSLDGIALRLGQVGLPSCAVTVDGLRRDLIGSIARNEKAQPARVGDVDDALVRLRKVLVDYRAALSGRDPQLGISVLDALSELTRLAKLSPAPATTARLERASLGALAQFRAEATADLIRAAQLGQFRYGPADSPWYGAHFTTSDEAKAAHELAKKLNHESVPALLAAANTLVEQTRLRAFESIAELGLFLRLLADVRDTLDRFQPAVFDRPIGELIQATSSQRDDMPGATRRRLRKLAYEYVRPGVSVPDIHQALTRVQQQRTLWQRYSEAGAIPTVPTGINEVAALYQSVDADLASLDTPLRLADSDRRLAARPIRDLIYTLSGLAAESEVLINLHERTSVLAKLYNLGLDPLVRDLANRHVPEEQVGAELELAWWQSALEVLLTSDKALLGANTQVLDRLEADFRLVDEAHASSTGLQMAWQLAEAWNIGVVDWPEEADALKRLLKTEQPTSRELNQSAPHLLKALAPVWLASPYAVHRIDDSITFDAVLLIDAGATSFVENLSAIRRAKQVVAFGDSVTQMPSPFGIHSGHAVATPEDVEALQESSVLAQLAPFVPNMALTRSYRAGGEDLAQLVNSRYYDGRIEALPWAGSFLGHGSLSLHSLNAKGTPDPLTGTVESIDVEVAKVVELVMEHAVKRPKESLMVVTASAKHAARVYSTVLAALAKRGDLSDFFLKDRAEPFTVLTLDQAVAQSRDRVIFSVGYGRTPHGRLLSDFGPLSLPGGDRLLAVAMTGARRSLDIVTSFGAEDIDDRQSAGVLALAHMIAATAERATAPRATGTDDAMLADLAARLEARGLRVALGYDGKLALAVAGGGKAAVVETDPQLVDSSLREALRLRPHVLRRLGWHYIRVHSFDLFANPTAVVERIAKVLGVAASNDADASIT
ncbi:MAG TPA: AAA family ATPase [Microbacteriaceae bacterium]|nr:AAA family ATPase [Microbacteriaceae bacterium]